MVESNGSLCFSNHPQKEGSIIISRFKGKKIFLTGATGYLGKTLLEKLLRTCHSIDKFYLLVRNKKGIDLNKRFDEIFSGPVWSSLEENNPRYREKVHLMGGDMRQPNLGLNEENIQILKSEVNIIFHCAATVRFDQHIRIAAYINVRAVRDLLAIVKDSTNLNVFLYVSTAYSNCPEPIIDEKFYEPPMNHEDLLELVDLLSDEKLTEITPTLMHPWPNTYTFTKTISESIIKQAAETLPVCLCRPAIITGAVAEPLPGWIGNIFGPSGIIAAVGSGLARLIPLHAKRIAEVVPSDYIANSMIAAASQHFKDQSDASARKRVHNEDWRSPSSIVYNYCSSPQSMITWGQFMDFCWKMSERMHTNKTIWAMTAFAVATEFWYYLLNFLLHTIPAHIIDLVLKLRGRSPIAVEGYKKFHHMMLTFLSFSLRDWKFTNENVQKLWKMLNEEDKKLFPFSMENFDWDKYFETYIMGVRLYIFNDPAETIPQALIRHKFLKALHYTFIAFIIVIMYYFFSSIFSSVRYLYGLF